MSVKRLIKLLFAILLLLLTSTFSFAFAQEDQTIQSSEGIAQPDYIVPPYPRTEPFFGQDHSYSAVFRGNGEAVVTLRAILTNTGDSPLKEISLRVPKVEPKEISAYQVIRDRVCIRYEPQVYDPVTRRYPPQKCAEYQDPDYYSYWGSAKYQKAKTEFSGDTLSLVLPKPIESQKSGSYFVYFRAFGYAKKNIFGSFKYSFESLKVEDQIRNLAVGINTDSDLILKGAKGKVEYRFEDTGIRALSGAGADLEAIASPAVDRFVSQIGQGQIVKTASNLASLESYKVEGQYAAKRIQLYAKEITIGGAVVVIVLSLLALLAFLIARRLRKINLEVKETPKSRYPQSTTLILISLGVSFISSILIAGYTALVIVLGRILLQVASYEYDAILTLFLVIISFCAYVVLLLAPGVYIGVKKGVGWGIGTVVLTIFWLFGYLVMAVLILFLIGGTFPSPITPLPLLEGFSK